MPSIMARRAPGMARAVARPPEGATSLSAVPWMTRVGAVMWRSSAARSPDARMAGGGGRGRREKGRERAGEGAGVVAAVVHGAEQRAQVFAGAVEAGGADDVEE